MRENETRKYGDDGRLPSKASIIQSVTASTHVSISLVTRNRFMWRYKSELCGGPAILGIFGTITRRVTVPPEPEKVALSAPTRPHRDKTVVTLLKKALILAYEHSLLLRPRSNCFFQAGR